MQIVSINYTIKYELDFAPEYKWLNTNQCYNSKTGRIIKQIYVSGSIGYCIKRKFYTLKNLRKHLVKSKKEYCPF